MRIRAIALSLGAAVALTGLSTTTANAYDNSDLSVSIWGYDTDYCLCENSSGLDYTGFAHDAGGYARKFVVRKNGTAVAQVEFHPSSEVLYVYDGVNDGDGIYARVTWDESNDLPDAGTYGAPGTSAVLDMNKIQLDDDDDIVEGTAVNIRLYDDKELTDPISNWYTATA